MITEGAVTTDKVHRRNKETLDGDNGIFMSCRLLNAKLCLSER